MRGFLCEVDDHELLPGTFPRELLIPDFRLDYPMRTLIDYRPFRVNEIALGRTIFQLGRPSAVPGLALFSAACRCALIRTSKSCLAGTFRTSELPCFHRSVKISHNLGNKLFALMSKRLANTAIPARGACRPRNCLKIRRSVA
jgi:hypothetical protein